MNETDKLKAELYDDIVHEKNKEYIELTCRFRETCNDIKKKDKEIERLKGALQTHEILLKSNVLEIERLNNIINEIEKMMKNDLECACSMNENGLFNGAIDMLEVYLDKLQQLKGSDKE